MSDKKYGYLVIAENYYGTRPEIVYYETLAEARSRVAEDIWHHWVVFNSRFRPVLKNNGYGQRLLCRWMGEDCKTIELHEVIPGVVM